MKVTAPGEVGSNIRELRRRASITVDQLAYRSKLHHTVVSNVERGVNEPDLDTAIKLAHSLGLTLGDVFRGPEDKLREAGGPT